MMKSDEFSYCARLARDRDYGRYLCALAAPIKTRNALLVLLAFNDELGKVREIVSEPTLGDIRLAWWRETLIADQETEGGSHPVARALKMVVQDYGVSKDTLQAMIDGRARDMDPMPFTSVDELEDYAVATAGKLAQAFLQVLEVDDEESCKAVSEVATAWALIGFLRSVPYHEQAGRRVLGRQLVPADILDRVDDLLIAARGRGRRVTRKAYPVLLTARISDLYLSRYRSTGCNVYKTNLDFAPLTPVWRVTTGRLSGRY
jgi:NADH dehydrogenase [ubiquinone] 1 alpha subcomplex assembly factor 6